VAASFGASPVSQNEAIEALSAGACTGLRCEPQFASANARSAVSACRSPPLNSSRLAFHDRVGLYPVGFHTQSATVNRPMRDASACSIGSATRPRSDHRIVASCRSNAPSARF
jgi:hypothetical protein